MYAFRIPHASGGQTREASADAAPREAAAARQQTVRSALTEPELRRQVMLDMTALMNSIALESTLDLSPYEHVRRSILNFGCPDISTRTIDEARLSEVREEIEAALKLYEPRLIRDTVKVTREAVVGDDLRLRYVVRADLACIPVSVPVQFVADVELDSGSIAINRL
jgi:type VI secretion system protein ImpF